MLDWIDLALASGLSLLTVCLICVPELTTGLNLGDEGYLWFGTRQVLDSKVPIRDFRAYDPGRYYLCALGMRLFGRGLISLRVVLCLVQVVGLALGLSVIHHATGDWAVTVFGALALGAWMFTLHKQIEIAFCIGAVFMAVVLLGNPLPLQSFIAGAFVGVSFFFGINLGLYNGTGLFCLLLSLLFRAEQPPGAELILWYALGVGVGLLPTLGAFACIPGYFKEYWRRKVMKVVKRGHTNLPSDFPWLWGKDPYYLHKRSKLRRYLIKLCFTSMPFFYAGVLLWYLATGVGSSPADNVIFGSACVGVFYMHHVLSRADMEHMGTAIHPLLIALLVLVFKSTGDSTAAVAALSIPFLALIKSRQFIKRMKKPERYVRCTAGEEHLWLRRSEAQFLEKIGEVVEAHSKKQEPVIFVPAFSMFYPYFDRTAPIYDIFCVYPASEEDEQAMIASIDSSGVRLLLISDLPGDSRDELRFRNTHPQVWKHINTKFEALEVEGLPADHYFFLGCAG